MKKIKHTCWILALVLLGTSSCKKEKSDTSSLEVDGAVKELLAKMTVEEKAGQMTQIDIRNLLNDGYANTDQKLDKEKLKEAIHTYKVGSLLNCIHAYEP